MKNSFCNLTMNYGSTEFTDNVIANLKIIAMLQKAQRLCVRKGQLTLERDDRFQFLRRYVRNDSRDTIVLHIRDTVSNAIKIARSTMEVMAVMTVNTNMPQTVVQSAGPCFSEWTLIKIMNELENARQGLINLKTTYSTDAIMIANLDVIVDRIAINCEDIAATVANVATVALAKSATITFSSTLRTTELENPN